MLAFTTLIPLLLACFSLTTWQTYCQANPNQPNRQPSGIQPTCPLVSLSVCLSDRTELKPKSVPSFSNSTFQISGVFTALCVFPCSTILLQTLCKILMNNETFWRRTHCQTVFHLNTFFFVLGPYLVMTSSLMLEEEEDDSDVCLGEFKNIYIEHMNAVTIH